MKALLEDNRGRLIIYSIRQKLFYLPVLFRQKIIIRLLKKIGVFDQVRTIYRKMKRSL